MLKFLELCQNSSWAQIMFPYQDLSNRNLPLNTASWGGFCIKCCTSGQCEADDPSAGPWWTLSIRWTYPQGLPEAESPAWKLQSRCGQREKGFPMYFLYNQQAPFPRPNLIICSFRILGASPYSLTMVKGGSVERLCRVRLPKPAPWRRQSGSRRLLEKRLGLTVHEGQRLRSLLILFNTFLLFWFFSSFECVKMGNELISRKKTS